MLRRLVIALTSLFFLSMPAFAKDPKFEDYPVEVWQGKLAAPKLKSGTDFWKFRTRIREGAASEGINFAGHYTVVTWGCGTECGYGAIVDRRNGALEWLPSTLEAGIEHHANSTLLIINPDISGYGNSPPEWLTRRFYVRNKTDFALILQDQKVIPQEPGESDVVLEGGSASGKIVDRIIPED